MAAFLSRKQHDAYRIALERKQEQLVTGLRRRDGIEVVTAADTFDVQQEAVERELLVQNLERDSILLRDVREALRRLEEGSFGVCTQCDGEISPRRLAAVPWAPFCIRCQEHHDRGTAGREEPLAELT